PRHPPPRIVQRLVCADLSPTCALCERYSGRGSHERASECAHSKSSRDDGLSRPASHPHSSGSPTRSGARQHDYLSGRLVAASRFRYARRPTARMPQDTHTRELLLQATKTALGLADANHLSGPAAAIAWKDALAEAEVHHLTPFLLEAWNR